MSFTLVADTSARDATGAGHATTPAVDTTTADLIVITAASDTNATPTDSYSNTWTGLTARTVSGLTTRIWYCNPPSGKHGTGHTFTVTAGISSLCIMAFKGAEQVSVFDVENGATSASAASLATGSVTPTNNNSLVYTGVSANNQVQIQTVSAPFSQLDNQTGTSSAFSVSNAYEIQTTATARNPTWTDASAQVMAVAIAVFRSQVNRREPTGATLALTGATPGFGYLFYPGGASLTLTGKTPHFAYVDGALQVQIAGVDKTSSIIFDSILIRDVLNQPMTMQMVTLNGYHPAEGSQVIIKRGTFIIFKGAITATNQVYYGKPVNLSYVCSCIDQTYYLRKRVPFAQFDNQSASVIVGSLVATYSTFGTDGVQGGLTSLSQVYDGSQDLDQILTDIAKLVGANHYLDPTDNQVYMFQPSSAPTMTIDDNSTDVFNDPAMTISTDLTQIRNRVFIRGAGDTLDADVSEGETILPISKPSIFNPVGGQAFVEPATIISYDGVQDNTVPSGSLIGYGVTPDAPVTLALEFGSGLGVGVYEYAETWVTSAGETLPSPIATITTVDTFTLSNPTGTPSLNQYDNFIYFGNGTYPNYNATDTFGPHIGDTIQYAVSISTKSPFSNTDLTQETALSPYSSLQTVFQSTYAAGYGITCCRLQQLDWFAVTNPYGQGSDTFQNNLLNSGITGIHFWRKVNGGTATLVKTFWDIFQVVYNPAMMQDSQGPDTGSVPAPNATVAAKRKVSVTPTISSQAGVTSRRIYRSIVNGADLKLLTTYSDNVDTTPFHDTTADGSLGAAAPTSDTSGLQGALSNGSGFYTTSNVTFSTNGAATNATTTSPSFTSASYTFVAADVGAVLYIKSGTNWLPGRYTIVSVSAGAAILGQAIATTASPTNATWGVDYSTLPSPRYSFSDIAIGGANSSTFTSAANPVGVNFIGNVVSVNFSIGFILQRVVVLSVSGTTATCDKSIGTVSSTAGTGTLGGPPPATSVSVGQTYIPVTNIGVYQGTGGWVDSGHQLIRYGAIDTTTRRLTGIPSSGPGSIVAPIPFNTTLINVSTITGVVGMPESLAKTNIRIFIQRDNTESQSALAAIEGGDGIHEAAVIDNPDLTTDAAMAAVGDADLNDFSGSILTVNYVQHNLNIHTGKAVTITRTSPPVSGIFTIQDVTITRLWDLTAGPSYTVRGSNVKMTLQDILAQVITLLRAGGI